MIGRTVSHYQIVGQLGAGGMGVVYAAEDARLGRQVALKFVPEELAKDRQAVERLRSEARTASGLNHPNICTIYDIGEYEGRPFIVMELLKGQTLRERLANGPLRIHEAVELGIQVADALDSAHHRGIMHRDIKPANLFLVERGQVKILDFGLAKLVRHATGSTTTGSTRDHTAEGVTLGTVSYMSPEQVTGEPLDGRTDLFSLGVVLYECVTGHQPFTGKTSAVIFSAILTRAPVAPVVFNPELPLRLQEVINNCLEKDRELRYQDAAGLRADLKRVKRDLESGHSGVFRIGAAPTGVATTAYGSGQQTAIDTASRPPLEHSGATRRPIVTITVSLLLGAVLAAAGAFVFWQRARSTATAPAPGPATGSQESYVRSRIGLATTSLDAKDYHGALGYADDVLRVAPNDAEATRIRDAARTMIRRFDQAVARARERLSASDTEGAQSAINEARAIEPGSPALAELQSALVAQLRAQAEAARREAQRRPAPPPVQPPSRQAPADTAHNEPPHRESGSRGATPAPPPSRTESSSTGTMNPVPPPPAPVQPPPPQQQATPPQTAPQQQPAPQPTPPASSGTPTSQAPAQSAPSSPPAAQPTRPPETAPEPQPSEPPAPRREPTPAARGNTPAQTESDEAAIRRVVQSYGRAIESKDIGLFRRVKPNMTPEEQRRVEEGFRAVTSQQVNITILSVEQHGQEASVRLRRRDTIQAGGRQQTIESFQTLTLTKSGSGWVIREIGQ